MPSNGDGEPESEHGRVMKTVRDYIFESHRFPSVSQISEMTGIGRKRSKQICEDLIGQQHLYPVFGGGKGLPRVVVPYEMMQSVLRTQSKPDWLADPSYTFEERKDLEDQLGDLRERISEFDLLERLLYAQDIPLEEAVAFALKELGFEEVVHHSDDPDNPDVTFQDGRYCLAEIEGTRKQGREQKVQQLNGWVTREIEENDRAREELHGFYILNHQKDVPPEERGDPLSRHAKEFMKHYGFTLVTTTTLFSLVRDVWDQRRTRDKAREIVLEGEEVDT